MPKEEILSSLEGITTTWDCQGAPDALFCDNGKEFHSTSMQATEAALGMRIVYLPRRRPWLKGKIERWFGTLEEQVVHHLPGTTFSNVSQRGAYQSENFAVVTFDQINWLITKWIVDVYHQDIHSSTGQAPADRWRQGIELCGQKLPPPKELIIPLVGMVVPRSLTRQGIKFKGLVWNSNGFSALRNRLGDSTGVSIRIDPMDLSIAYAFDEQNRKWVTGDLQTNDVDVKLTLHQYEVVKAHAEKTRLPDEDRKSALARSRGEIFDFVKQIIDESNKSKAPRRYARFVADGRKASEHIAPSREDPAQTGNRVGSHLVRDDGAVVIDAARPMTTELETSQPDSLTEQTGRRVFPIRRRAVS